MQLTKRALQVNTDAAGLDAALELENRNQVLSHATDDAAARRQKWSSEPTLKSTEGRPMAWDFSTDPEWAEQLAWVEEFVRSECEPIDLIVKESHDLDDPVRQALIPPLQQIVKERGLWATHLGPHLGGPGYGQMKLALLNEILGRSECAPIVFGSQAPDSGNSEILAHYGTPELKAALPRAAARQPDRLLLLDDRAAGRRRPEGVHHHRGPGRRPLGHQRREVVSRRSRRWRRSSS